MYIDETIVLDRLVAYTSAKENKIKKIKETI
jgi:hypothetical protein